MTQQERRDAYLAKAREAEEFASLCPDMGLREGWLKIAAGYVELAKLEPGVRYLINPGSVGQPRDRDIRASFAIIDTKRRTVQFLRVSYDIEKTQTAILKAGLPRILADRLAHGT